MLGKSQSTELTGKTSLSLNLKWKLKTLGWKLAAGKNMVIFNRDLKNTHDQESNMVHDVGSVSPSCSFVVITNKRPGNSWRINTSTSLYRKQVISYQLEAETGTPQNREYIISCEVQGRKFRGQGRNKKQARAKAAEAALMELHKIIYDPSKCRDFFLAFRNILSVFNPFVLICFNLCVYFYSCVYLAFSSYGIRWVIIWHIYRDKKQSISTSVVKQTFFEKKKKERYKKLYLIS